MVFAQVQYIGTGTCMVLKFYTSMEKKLKLNVTKFHGLIFTFVEVTRKKPVGGLFVPHLLSWKWLKLKCSFHKTNAVQMVLTYIGPTIWSKIADTLKRTKNFNMFKHNLKEHYLKGLKSSDFR